MADLVRGVFATGVPFGAKAWAAFIGNQAQHGFSTETFFDWTLGPIRDSDDKIVAVFNIASEVTDQILLDRRMVTLSSLATKAARGISVDGVCHAMTGATEGSLDVPWMAIYVREEQADKQDMDFADQLAGQGTSRSLGRHQSSRQPFKLVATSFDKGLVHHPYTDGDKLEDAAPDEDEDGNPLSYTRSSREGEDRFEPGTSTRILPAWLPSLPSRVKLNGTLRERRESLSSSSVESTLLGSGSTPSTMSGEWSSQGSTPLQAADWPFEDLSSESPHLIISTPSDTSPWSETIMITVATLSPTTGRRHVLGVVVAGLNEHRKLDDAYLAFFQSIIKRFETALINGRAREEDRKASDALKRLNYDRVQFFQNTAHELRTPLTLMLGPLEELVKAHTAAIATPSADIGALANAIQPAPSPVQTLSRLSLISRNARRLLKLVNSILRFSSIEAGKLDTRFERQTSFGMVTRHLAECFEPLAAQSGVALRLEHGLSSTSEDETAFDKATVDGLKEDVFIDLDLWEQIIFNTLSNAFKNTWKGAVTVSLREQAEDGIDGFRLDVADTGVGIAAHQLKSIFERFYRADNSEARVAEGTGIGLSLVRELVRLHGGNISATSELGVGTTFTVWIPRGLNHLPHDRVFATPDPGHPEAEVLRRLNGDGLPTTREAGDRWNAKARGVERAAVLEQMDNWISASTMSLPLGQPSPSDPPPPLKLHPLSSRASQVTSGGGSPTPLAAPAGLAEGSYFPEVPPSMSPVQENNEMADELLLPGFKKRKIAVSASDSSRRSSAKHSSSRGRTSSAQWFSKAQSSLAADADGSHIVIEPAATENIRPGVGRILSGLPQLDPSDRPTVLIVDDNQDMRFWISSILQVDYNIVEARNGREALDVLANLTPDLVLSDVNMPLVNGLSLVKQIRSSTRIGQIPVILLSARSGQDDAIEGLDAGAADYLTKPFNVRDLTARVRVHIRLNRLRLQTQEVETELVRQQSRTEAKNNLLGLVSHELRTPLQTISGAAELLSHAPGVPQDLVGAISSGAETLRGRIDQLIDVAQVGSNKFRLTMETFELDAILTATLARHTPAAARKGLNMFSIVGRAPAYVTTDRERLLQVMDVLLANAVKFTAAGEIVLRVWVENGEGDELEVAGPEEGFLCFAVADSGAGIPAELAASIFQPFSLADSSSTRAHGGAGLGLTLALRIVELAGGQLGVESTLGQGSEFRCRWPMQMQLMSPTHDHSSLLSPVAVVVSSSEAFGQSIACTAAAFGWETRDAVDTIAAAHELLTNHSGSKPLVFFVDEAIVQHEPQPTKDFLDRLAIVRTPALADSNEPGTRSYAVIATTGNHNFDDFVFHGRVTPPFYRTHVRAVVGDILAHRLRPMLFSPASSNGDSSAAGGASRMSDDSDATSKDPFPHGRLLVAEDNKVNAKLLIRQLKLLGFAADEAEHGLKVIDLIRAEHNTPLPSPDGARAGPGLASPSPYCGILMDLDMPVMDGFEATRQLRGIGGRYRDLPVLAVSANGSMDIRERVAAAGMDDFLSKPVSVAQLTALLQRNGLITAGHL